jgi:hypothetical protein
VNRTRRAATKVVAESIAVSSSTRLHHDHQGRIRGREPTKRTHGGRGIWPRADSGATSQAAGVQHVCADRLEVGGDHGRTSSRSKNTTSRAKRTNELRSLRMCARTTRLAIRRTRSSAMWAVTNDRGATEIQIEHGSDAELDGLPWRFPRLRLTGPTGTRGRERGAACDVWRRGRPVPSAPLSPCPLSIRPPSRRTTQPSRPRHSSG